MIRSGRQQAGLSLIELMIAIALGLFIVSGILGVYLAQSQIYRTGVSQAVTQSAENAISALVTPVIRGAGFSGCGTVVQVLSNLNAGGPAPIGNLGTTAAIVAGYEANTTISQANAANDTSASHWTPSLDSTLVGNVEAGSDVVVVLGAVPFSSPVGVTTIASGSSTLTVQSAPNISAGQFGAVSDCAKASIFKVTSAGVTTLNHAAGTGALNNATAAFAVNYAVGSQFIPVQQTAFFVGQGLGGQSTLMRGVLNGTTGTAWTIEPLVPGVDVMQVQYGIGTNGQVTQYVGANSVIDWAQVYAIRLGFLISGQTASGSPTGVSQTQFTILGNTVTIPADSRLRHVYELTIYLRNALS